MQHALEEIAKDFPQHVDEAPKRSLNSISAIALSDAEASTASTLWRGPEATRRLWAVAALYAAGSDRFRALERENERTHMFCPSKAIAARLSV